MDKLPRKLARIGLVGFETSAKCADRQVRMIALLERHGLSVPKSVQRCSARECSREVCVEGCHFATRTHRAETILAGYALFSDIELPLLAVSIVRDTWVAKPGELALFDHQRVQVWVKRRFAETNAACGIFSVEASLNADLDGRRYWSLGVHGVVAGVEKTDIHKALRIPSTKHSRAPVVVDPVNNLAVQLGYVLKRFVQERRQYRAPNGRLRRRPLPLRTKDQTEHDAWLLGLKAGARTFLFRCCRNGGGELSVIK